VEIYDSVDVSMCVSTEARHGICRCESVDVSTEAIDTESVDVSIDTITLS